LETKPARGARDIWNIATQLMGDFGEHVNFDSNKIRINGGAFQAFDGTPELPDPAWYSMSGSALSFDTWDDTC
jgi:hypothetical protein